MRKPPGIDLNELQVTGVCCGLRNALRVGCLGALLGVPLSGNDQTSAIAGSRVQAIRSSIDRGRCVEAVAQADGLLATFESAPAGASADVGQTLDSLVEALLCDGRGGAPRTKALAERVIRSREARLGPTDLTLATSRRNLGDVLVQSGEYQLARPQYEQALRIRKNGLGPNHPDVADDLDHLARVLTFVEKSEEALAASDQALAIKERTLE